jgi:two-component system KDP operon response regulator KdpE
VSASNGQTILVIEDELAMRRLLRATLEAHGFRVVEAATMHEGRRAAAAESPALVILDLGLPDGDGVELVRSLREWSQMPIVVVSARDREPDKVRALDAGADDYLTKPFGTGELLARMRVALRHAAAVAGTPAPDAVVEVGPIRIDHGRHEVTVDGKAVHLTPIEFRLLALLMQHPGRVLTHRHLLKEVWGPGASEQTHYLRVHMGAVRRKIESDPARPHWLLTEPGAGYRMRDPDADATDDR